MSDADRQDVKARTVKDFCQTYGIGKSLVYELITEGRLSAVKAGKRTLITEDSAKAWFESLPKSSAKPTRLPTRSMAESRGR